MTKKLSNEQRNWNEGWAQLDTTIKNQDVWLLTDRIKLNYLIQYIKPGDKALEVGCGSAKLSAMLANAGLQIYGFDLAPNALRVARQNMDYLDVTAHLSMGDALNLPVADNQLDVVFSTGLLEHFQNPVPIIAEMRRILRPGGLFFSDVAPLKFSLLRAGFYLRGFHKTVEDEYSYNANDITDWLKQCNFQDIRVFSSGIVPPLVLIRRLSFIRYLSFKYESIWTRFDKTRLGDLLGFFYLAFARK